MCGIVGYRGIKHNAIDVLLKGLSNLEYRGYDSAGIAYSYNDKIKITKSVGKIANLNKIVKHTDLSSLGIGHTRWATHGGVNETNSHPHHVGKFTIVHNGIIENYDEIKSKLIKDGYKFITQTDTEVACALIDSLYKKMNSVESAINEAMKTIKGSYAFGILKEDDDKLYIAKNKSPLIIGVGDNEYFIASDVPAILEYTNKYITLNDQEYGVLSDDIKIYDIDKKEVKWTLKTFEGDSLVMGKAGYDYFMEKEMFEQPEIFKRNIKYYLKEHFDYLPDLSKYKNIDIVACGSAYHAGLIGKSLIEEYAKKRVNVEIASEYRYSDLEIEKDTLLIAISQSGETADTLAALEKAKESGAYTLAIVNVKDSSIARAADKVLYTNAGSEIAVATTKAYSAQVTLLSLIALKLSNLNIDDVLKQAKKVPSLMEEVLNYDYTKIAKKIHKQNDIYFLGRKVDYMIALEASLKLKEISYIHSEAYAAGELKHGTISLIEKNTPVVSILTKEDIILKTLSNIKETKARGAYTVIIKSSDIETFADYEIKIPSTIDLFMPLIAIIPLQRIAFEVAKMRGCDIDMPKNLAKSVTVE